MTATFVAPSRLGLVFALFALGACGTTGGGESDTLGTPVGTKPYAPYLVGVPYQISGKWYHPKENLSYDRTGMASWYGKDFHGRRTANGETYDINKITAAHPTLPMPTIARVTNLENNRSVLVRINDRGPFANDRIIDLSRRAAQELGFLRAGTARVRVTVLRSRTEALKRQGGTTTVAEVTSPMRGPDPMDPTHRGQYKETRPDDTPSGVVRVAERTPRDDDRRARDQEALEREVREREARDREARDREARDREETARRGTDDAAPRHGAPVDLRPRDLRAEDRVTAPKVVSAPTTQATIRRIYVQAGAYTERDRALRIGRKLKPLGHSAVSSISVRETQFFRVRVGPVRTAEDGDRILARMVSMGYTGARIVVE